MGPKQSDHNEWMITLTVISLNGFHCNTFFVGICSWLADKLHFILSYEAGFYKPSILKVHPPFCRITAYATMPG
jgi:hypothetical protein